MRTGFWAFGVFSALLAATASAQDPTKMVIWVDADGSTYIQNNSKTETFVIDGYTLASQHNDLLWQDYDGVKGWRAFEDILPQFFDVYPQMNAQFGPAAAQMGSANPGPGNLTEVTLNVAGLSFSPGEKWFIGKPFTTPPCAPGGNGPEGYSFLFKTIDNLNQQVGGFGPCIPEPSSWLLACLGGLGLAAKVRRGKAKVQSRQLAN